MIRAGAACSFAIDCEVTRLEREWVFGHVRFWLQGRKCGNWHDDVDLRSCYSWLFEFATTSVDRYEKGLIQMPADKVFRLLTEYSVGDVSFNREPFKQTFSRFDISHLASSAFDGVSMILVQDPETERCIWKEGDGLHEVAFPRGHMQRTALQFCEMLKSEAIGNGANADFPILPSIA